MRSRIQTHQHSEENTFDWFNMIPQLYQTSYQCTEIQGEMKNDPLFLLTIKWQVHCCYSLNCTGEMNTLLHGDSQRDMWIPCCYITAYSATYQDGWDWLSSKEWKLFCFFAKTESTVTIQRHFCSHFKMRWTPSQENIYRLTQQKWFWSKNDLMLQVFILPRTSMLSELHSNEAQ